MKKYFLLLLVLCSCSALTVTNQDPPKSCHNPKAGMCNANYQGIPSEKVCQYQNGECKCWCESR